MRRVLILSSREDGHAQAVASHLQQMHVHIDFLRREDFIQSCRLSYRSGMDQGACHLEMGGVDLDLLGYSAIWYRRPGGMKPRTYVEPWIAQIVELEASRAFDGILRTLSCTWMNYPLNDQASLNKLWQLNVAKMIGLTVPETIVTNKPELVKAFFEECNGEVVYKFISESSNLCMPPGERPSGISTLPLRKEDLPYIDQVIHAPHQFQRCIQKAYELRVTIVGKKIFCIRIDSQSGRGKIDWRLDYSVPMEPYELPDPIGHKCLSLMQQLGLNYGAIDFVVNREGEYVFLEINCAGQYLWVEDLVKIPISLEVAKLLAGESDPLVISPAQKLRLNESYTHTARPSCHADIADCGHASLGQ